MTIECFTEDDGSLTIQWDENDPVESMLNTWTEKDFINAILSKAKEVLGEEEYNATLNGSSVTLEDNTCTETGEEPEV